MKCPICGKRISNPEDLKHVRSRRHQEALKIHRSQKDLSASLSKLAQPTTQITESLGFINLKKRLEKLEKKYENLKSIIIILIDELDAEGALTDTIVSKFFDLEM